MIYAFVSVGAILILFKYEIMYSVLGYVILVGIFLFWVGRLIEQLIFLREKSAESYFSYYNNYFWISYSYSCSDTELKKCVLLSQNTFCVLINLLNSAHDFSREEINLFFVLTVLIENPPRWTVSKTKSYEFIIASISSASNGIFLIKSKLPFSLTSMLFSSLIPIPSSCMYIPGSTVNTIPGL